MSDKTLPDPVIHNMVATASLGMKLDLKSIATRANNAEFNPKRFSAVVLRIRDPKTTAMVFSSGKMVLTGAKDESSAKTAAKKHLKTIQKCGFQAAKLTVCICRRAPPIHEWLPWLVIRSEETRWMLKTNKLWEISFTLSL